MWSENSPMSPLCLRSVCFILSERPTLYRRMLCPSTHVIHINITCILNNAIETSSPPLLYTCWPHYDRIKGGEVHSPDSHGTMQHLTYQTLSVTPVSPRRLGLSPGRVNKSRREPALTVYAFYRK